MEWEHRLKAAWDRILSNKIQYWFFVTFTIYVLSLVVLYRHSMENMRFYNYLPKSGLIIGAFYPFLAFTYYHKNYLKGQGLLGKIPSILSWLLPALLTQVIVILGFIVLLGYPKPNFKQDNQAHRIRYNRSFFTAALHYGQLFKEFQKVQKDISIKREFNPEEITKLFNYYRPLLMTQETETCPPVKKEEHYLECLQKFAQMSEAINAIPFYLGITFGFLGALIFSLSDMVIRFNMVDLYPKNFVFYSIRFVVATSLCATLANFFTEEFPVIAAIPVFFLIGYFPERAINYLDQKMTEYLGFKTYEPLSLSLIQGMSGEKAFRLREIGIEDIQHLAVASVQDLKKNLPYSQDMICDWIAQSLLILYFNKQISALRDAGVRTILDLQGCLLELPENDVNECAKKIGISEMQLRHVCKILTIEPMLARVNELKQCLDKECRLKV